MMAQPVTIAVIERTTAIVGAIAAVALYAFFSPAVALGCAAGSAFMIVNFLLLAFVAGGIISLARGGAGLSLLGVLLIPVKLVFFLGIPYLLVSRLHVDVLGFVTGVLTQFAAIFIEVWRAAPRAALGAHPSTQGNKV